MSEDAYTVEKLNAAHFDEVVTSCLARAYWLRAQQQFRLDRPNYGKLFAYVARRPLCVAARRPE
ncbi:hypothetical protein SB778_23980 [Paraburkholderia sp. SIMBA_050]